MMIWEMGVTALSVYLYILVAMVFIDLFTITCDFNVQSQSLLTVDCIAEY